MMNWKGLITGVSLIAVALGWSGCKTGDVQQKPVICQSDVIRAGETIRISFHDAPPGDPITATDKDTPVRVDGSINVPLIGSVTAAGKTYSGLERELYTNYVPRYYQRLTIVIKPGERFYTVAGEVNNQSRQFYLGETTLLRVISSAGGFTEYANRRKVMIQRASGETEIVDCRKAIGNPKYDRPICPGDHIVVPRSL